jgi:hypothetical protein
MIRKPETGIGIFWQPSFDRESQVGRSGEVIDEEFAVRAGEFRSGDGERWSDRWPFGKDDEGEMGSVCKI